MNNVEMAKAYPEALMILKTAGLSLKEDTLTA